MAMQSPQIVCLFAVGEGTIFVQESVSAVSSVSESDAGVFRSTNTCLPSRLCGMSQPRGVRWHQLFGMRGALSPVYRKPHEVSES